MYISWKGYNVFSYNIPLKRPGVYAFLNLVNAKFYIGISIRSVSGRCSTHIAGRGSIKLRNALVKYGPKAFLIIPLFYTIEETDNSYLQQIEKDLIEIYDSVANGYNIINRSDGGAYGARFSALMREVRAKPEVKARDSAAATLRNLSYSPEYRKERSRKAVAVRIAKMSLEEKDKLRIQIRKIFNDLPKEKKTEIGKKAGLASAANQSREKQLEQVRIMALAFKGKHSRGEIVFYKYPRDEKWRYFAVKCINKDCDGKLIEISPGFWICSNSPSCEYKHKDGDAKRCFT